MPYTEEMKFEPPMPELVGGEENLRIISEALKAGKKVEWEFSTLKDPGPDWQQVRIDGEVLPGSWMHAY